MKLEIDYCSYVLYSGLDKQFLSYKGVKDIGIGFKLINNDIIIPYKICIIVYVEKKKNDVDEEFIKPKYEYNGIEVETDVIEIKK